MTGKEFGRTDWYPARALFLLEEAVKTIRELRYSRGLTQKQLARMLGVSVIMVSLWETRKAAPRLRRRYEISQMFGVPMEELDIERRVEMETGARVDRPVASDPVVQSSQSSATSGQ